MARLLTLSGNQATASNLQAAVGAMPDPRLVPGVGGEMGRRMTGARSIASCSRQRGQVHLTQKGLAWNPGWHDTQNHTSFASTCTQATICCFAFCSPMALVIAAVSMASHQRSVQCFRRCWSNRTVCNSGSTFRCSISCPFCSISQISECTTIKTFKTPLVSLTIVSIALIYPLGSSSSLQYSRSVMCM
jgi:hypothetical protein